MYQGRNNLLGASDQYDVVDNLRGSGMILSHISIRNR